MGWEAVDCALECREAEGYEEGEPSDVGGVRWLLEPLKAAAVPGRERAQNSEELELACELADPLEVRVSPGSDSLSSVEG